MTRIDEDSLQAEMTAWRHDLHAHPEFGFEEKRTSAFVAAKLQEFGLDEVVEGVGGSASSAHSGAAAATRRSRSGPTWTLCASSNMESSIIALEMSG